MKIKKMRIKDIKIQKSFEKKQPSKVKMKEKWFFYRNTGKLESDIIVNKEGYLTDGYTSYLIAEADGIKKVEVIEI